MSANVDLVRRLYDAIARGDVPGLLAGLDPTIEWTEADGFPYQGTYIGHDAVLEGVIGRLVGEWDGFRATPTELIDGGDQVVALGRYTGAYKGTGKQMDAAFAHVWDFRDGKALRFRQYVDSAIVQEALRS